MNLLRPNFIDQNDAMRIVFVEAINGPNFEAEAVKSSLVGLDGGAATVNVRYSIGDEEGQDEGVLRMLSMTMGKIVSEDEQLKALHVSGKVLLPENYEVSDREIVLDGAILTDFKTGTKGALVPGLFPRLAAQIGMASIPMLPAPIGLVRALVNGDSKTCAKMCKNIARYPSLLGNKHKHAFVAVLMNYETTSDVGKVWKLV